MSLKVWIVNPYGNIPGEGWRDYRSTMLATALQSRGHNTIWWVSNFEHREKRFRSNDWKDIEVSKNFLVRMVPTTPYKSHISIQRVNYERTFGTRFYERAVTCPPPDVIVLAEPALFISKWVIQYARRNNVKLIVDVLDLWPELFDILLPKRLSWAGKALFAPLYARRATLFKAADALVAVSRDYLNLAQQSAPKTMGEVVYLSIDVQVVKRSLSQQGPLPDGLNSKPEGEIWGIYAGTLGDNYDIQTILDAASIIESEGLPIRIIIAGEGPFKKRILDTIRSRNLNQTVYVGSLTPEALTRLYAFCDFALSTYKGRSTVSLPVKAYDYMSAGLPIINSLGRDLGAMVKTKEIGLQYDSESAPSLVNAIKTMAHDAHLRIKMRNNCIVLADSFDCSVQYGNYVSLIERVGQRQGAHNEVLSSCLNS